MSESEHSTAGRVDTSRVEAFSDGVLAVAITLLVFDLKTPKFETGELLDGLLRQWPAYVAYLASFLYLAVIWLNHHAVFVRVRTVDRGLKWANIAVLLTSSMLPFATAVLSAALQAPDLADQRSAIGLYALIAGLVCAAWLLVWQHLRVHPHLMEPDVDPDFCREGRLRAAAGVVLYAAGGLLGCLLTPWIALVVFVMLPPFYALTSEGLKGTPLIPPRFRSRRS